MTLVNLVFKFVNTPFKGCLPTFWCVKIIAFWKIRLFLRFSRTNFVKCIYIVVLQCQCVNFFLYFISKTSLPWIPNTSKTTIITQLDQLYTCYVFRPVPGRRSGRFPVSGMHSWNFPVYGTCSGKIRKRKKIPGLPKPFFKMEVEKMSGKFPSERLYQKS